MKHLESRPELFYNNVEVEGIPGPCKDEHHELNKRHSIIHEAETSVAKYCVDDFNDGRFNT